MKFSKIIRSLEEFGTKTDSYEIKKMRYDHHNYKIMGILLIIYKRKIFKIEKFFLLVLIRKVLLKRKEIISNI